MVKFLGSTSYCSNAVEDSDNTNILWPAATIAAGHPDNAMLIRSPQSLPGELSLGVTSLTQN